MSEQKLHSVPRTDAPELVDRINWYVACLEDVINRKVVRGLAEAEADFDTAMDELTGLFEQLEALHDVLYRIANVADRRPDGTYNYDRDALRQMARDALSNPAKERP